MCPCTESSPVETGFYWLQSRYYDPAIGRFINADGYASTGQGVLSYNMYVYCNNNPVNRIDTSGLCSKTISDFGETLQKTLSDAVSAINNVSIPKPLTEDQKVLIATVAAEMTTDAKDDLASSAARQAVANTIINRVGKPWWEGNDTVADICRNTRYDGYGDGNYWACMEYLNARDGSNALYEMIIWDVMAAYENDITGGCTMYYTPAAMIPAYSTPPWDWSKLSEVTIPGVDPNFEGRFYKVVRW